MPQATDAPLHRRVGLLAASLSGIGLILGAGIYVLIGEAAGEAGNGIWAAFLIGAIVAGATGLSYAELTALFPEAGAAAVYAREAFGRRIGFITGWMNICVNFVAAPAVAIGFGRYFESLVGIEGTIAAVVVIVLCVGIVAVGIRETVALAIIFTVIEAAGLGLVIVVGVPALGSVDLADVHNGWSGLIAAAALVFFAYQGFEAIATLSEEVVEPTKNIPRAFLIAIGVTTALYVLIASVAVSVVPWEQLAASGSPLALVVETEIGERAADALSLVALFATFNTVLLVLATGARGIYGMARRGLLPAVLGTVSATRRAPWVAVSVAGVVSIGFALTGDIGYVAQVANFAVFMLFIAVNGAVIRLRYSQPETPRPIRWGGSIGAVPVPAAIGLAGAMILASFMEAQALVTGLGALALGIALSFAVLRGKPATP